MKFPFPSNANKIVRKQSILAPFPARPDSKLPSHIYINDEGLFCLEYMSRRLILPARLVA